MPAIFFRELHFLNFLWLPWLCGQVFEDFWRQFFKLSSRVWILGAFGETFGPKWQLKIPIRAKYPPQCLSLNSYIFIKSLCFIFLWYESPFTESKLLPCRTIQFKVKNVVAWLDDVEILILGPYWFKPWKAEARPIVSTDRFDTKSIAVEITKWKI